MLASYSIVWICWLIFQLLARPELSVVLLIALVLLCCLYIAALPWAISCANEAFAKYEPHSFIHFIHDAFIQASAWLQDFRLWHFLTVVVHGYLVIECYFLYLLLSIAFALFYVIAKLVGYAIDWRYHLIIIC